jgi:hypothetical protein
MNPFIIGTDTIISSLASYLVLNYTWQLVVLLSHHSYLVFGSIVTDNNSDCAAMLHAHCFFFFLLVSIY